MEQFLNKLRAVLEERYTPSHHLVKLVQSFYTKPGDPPKLFRSKLIDAGTWDKNHFFQLNQVLNYANLSFGEEKVVRLNKVSSHEIRLVTQPLGARASSICIDSDPNFSVITGLVKSLDVVKSAVLLQHHGDRARDLCALLFQKKAQIDLYVQNPEKACNKHEQDKLRVTHDDFFSNLRGSASPGGRLRIFRFNEPASVRAVLIDGQILQVGWYTYHHLLKEPGAIEPGSEGSGADGEAREIDIIGHSRPMIVARPGDPEYEQLTTNLIRPIVAELQKAYPEPWREYPRPPRRGSSGA
jgi:hypothetical protein